MSALAFILNLHRCKKVLDNGKHVTDPNVVSQKFKSLIIKSNKKMNINLDGENCGTTPINVTVKPQLFKFFIHMPNTEKFIKTKSVKI